MNDCSKPSGTAGQAGPPSPGAGGQTVPATRIDVQSLLGTQREVILVLRGTEYRLRLTNKGKLILTK